MARRFFTSESVTEGHPDKICDRISDSILDAIIKEDKNARVACETTCTTGVVTVMGEITTSCYVDIPQIVRKAVCDIGFNNPAYGFDGNTCAVLTTIDKQSADISMGVEKSLELKDGETCSQSEIESFCAALPRYKRPKKIIFDKIPRNPTGKIEKPKLREKYCGESVVAQQIEM